MSEFLFDLMNDFLYNKPTDSHNVNMLAENLINVIKCKAKSAGMISKIKNNSGQFKPWYDFECVSLKKSVKRLLKNCKKRKI